jgi:hypothetical protein
MSRDPKSPLLKKRAMDALLESMTTDSYDSLGAHRRGEGMPEQKGTEFDMGDDMGGGHGFSDSPVIIPPADLTPPTSPEDAAFFKESEPKTGAVLMAPSKPHPIGKSFDEMSAEVNPVEEEKQEHEFFKEAPRTASVKVAGKNKPDPGQESYDFEHEKHIRSEMKTWAQYAEASDNTATIKPFDPAGQYLCGTCDMRRGTAACARVEGDISFERGGCKLYHIGDPEDDAPMKYPFPKKDVNYSEHKGGFSCARCEYSTEAAAADPEGRTGWCSFWGTHIEPKACCAEWDQDSEKDKAAEAENKEVEKQRKAAAEKLQVGGKGVDRIGEYEVLAIKGDKITYRYADGSTITGDLAIKQRINDSIEAEKARANAPKKVPGYLQEDEIEWTPEMAHFLGYLAGPDGRGKIFAETPPRYEEAVINKYYDITGQILEEGAGRLNIAPETKWAPELTTLFKPTEEIPDEISRLQQKPGLINRNQFTWALVRQGFRFGEKPNVELIRSKVPASMQDYFDMGANYQPQMAMASKQAKAKVLYHVTPTAKVSQIQSKGILPLQESNWVKGEDGERYGEGEIFAMDNATDAVRWAAKMDWEFNKGMGTGKISIIAFRPGKEKWEVDTADPMSQAANRGHWLKAVGAIKPAQIISSHVLEPQMVKDVVQGQDVKLGMEKEADVPTKSYGMGTPIGGTDNPDAGAEDDPTEGESGEQSLDMTSSLEDDDWEYDNDFDYEAEDARLAALDDEAELEAETHAYMTAAEIDALELPTALEKISSYEHGSWFSKSARPSEQKIELMKKQFKLTPEQMELVIAVDPSPNQSDFVDWIAKWVSKGGIVLPEDTAKIREQLEKFQKLKKSPAFTFNKDLQTYDPATLFTTLEQAEAAGMGSKKEKQRETVRTGADLVVNEGDIKVYEVTTPEAAIELGSGTNWCTANRGMAETYLAKGPLYIFFDAGSAVAQLQPESNAFMNRQDVCILENVRGDSDSGYYSRYDRNAEKFLADPAMAKALGMLADKRPKIKAWVEEHITSPEKVLEILGEESAKEITKNQEFDQSVVQYEKDKAEYDQKMEEYNRQMEAWNQTPAMQEYNRKLEEYKQKEEEYYRLRNEYYNSGKGEPPTPPERFNRYDKPEGEPEEPPAPYDPRNQNEGYNKRYKYQVRNALATGKPLPPEIEADLVGKDVGLDLLIKYGSLFHPGQDWAPLREAIFNKVKKDIGNTGWATQEGKYAVDYCAKFIKGPWPELEPLLFTKMFLQHRGLENMVLAVDYAIRGRRVRWPEFEEKLQKAKPSQAAGYGAAEYAIRVLRKPWTDPSLGIKKKKNGKTNQEELMIVGNPGEARKYAEAFFQGQRWTAFEESAMKAQHYKALINYAGDTLKRRWPELEAEILEGKKDSADQKGGRRRRWHGENEGSDLALAYAKKVVKGRWPEYEAKMLTFAASDAIKSGGPNDKYEPSHGEYSYGHNRLPDKIKNYITEVVQGRWQEFEQILLARYQQFPQLWITNQNLVDGYCTTLGKACKERYQDDSDVPEPTGNELPAEAPGNYARRERPNKNIQKSYTKFQQDPKCYWAEGEKRLVTRDEGYEAVLVNQLKERANPKDEATERDYGKGEKYIKFEDLAAAERPQGEIDYREQEKKPSYTIWNGMWIGWYGMDTFERYVDYMLDNGQEWPLGVDVVEIMEDIEDIRGRRSFGAQRKHRRPEDKAKAKAKEEADVMERSRQMNGLSPQPAMASYKAALLKKKALVDMAPSPTMLPPRDDIKDHLDQQFKDQQTKEIMQGVREPLNPKKKKRRPQINPNINPMGVAAASKEIPNGTFVLVNSPDSWEHKNWGIVKGFDGEDYHVAINDGNEQLVFSRTELRIPKNQDEIKNSLGVKTADYTQQDWEQDEASEAWLDQVRDAEDEAKRHFMQEDYIQQLADDFIPPKTMDELWEIMGDEYTAEFYGVPYKRVPDFTDQPTEGWEGKRLSSVPPGEPGRVYVQFQGKEVDFSSQEPMAAVRYAESVTRKNPGETAIFVIDEEGVVTEDTYINGQHVGETVEKFAFRTIK